MIACRSPRSSRAHAHALHLAARDQSHHIAFVQDSAQLARASFESDVIVSQMIEYETLQLVMGELRDRFQAYLDNQARHNCTASGCFT
jgi:hypothetical protein